MTAQKTTTAAKQDPLAALHALAAMAPRGPAQQRPPAEPLPRPDLALIDASIDEAKADLAGAQQRLAGALEEGDACRSAMAALGSEPQPAEYEEFDQWRDAKARWEFDRAKLQPLLAAIEARQSEAGEALKAPTHRLRTLETNRQRAVVEHKLADLEDASAAMIAALRSYELEYRKLEPGARQGLWLNDRQQLLRGYASAQYTDSARYELVFIAPVN